MSDASGLRTLVIAGTCALALLQATKRATADLKVVTQLNVTGLPAPTRTDRKAPVYPRTITIYYRGDKARVEVAGGAITLYDYATDRIYALDPKTKTYTVASLRRVSGQPASTSPLVPIPHASSQSRMVATLVVTETGEPRTIADKDAHRFTFTGSIDQERSLGSGTGMPAPSPRHTGRRDTNVPVQVDGEVWLSGMDITVGVDSKYSAPYLPAFAAILSAPPSAEPLIVALMAQTAFDPGMPLASRVTLTIQQKQDNMATPPAPIEVVVTSEVKSVSDEMLDDTLFALPGTYTKERRR